MADMALKAVFSLVDRITAPIKKITDNVDRMTKGFDKVTGATKKTSSAFDRVDNLVKRVTGAVSKSTNELSRYTKNANAAAHSSIILSEAMKLISIAAIVTGIKEFATGVFNVNAQFESYEATLKTILGSQEKAKAAMSWVQQFATETPYDLDQVTQAFVKMSSYGIDPQARALKSLGNAASGMNKELDQAVEALADAQTGEFERLKEFGIRTKVQGQQVVFTYTKAGKEIQVLSKNSASAIQKNLLDIFDARFAGAMKEQTGAAFGILSGIRDTFTNLDKMIGGKGFFEHVKDRLKDFLETTNNLTQTGQLDAWAQKMSDAMIKLFDAVDSLLTSIDWVALTNNIAGFIDGAVKLVTALGGLENIVNIGIAAWIVSLIGGLAGLVPALAAVTSALIGLEIATVPLTAPIYLIIAALAVLAGAAFLIWRNWEPITKWFSGVWDGIKNSASKFISWISDNFMSLPLPLKFLALPVLIIKNWDKITAWFSGIFNWLKEKFLGLPVWAQAIISLPLTIIAHWQEIVGWFSDIWAQVMVGFDGLKTFFTGAWDALKGVFSSGVDSLWNILPDWFKGILKGAAFAIRFVTGGPDFTKGNDPKGGGPFTPRGPAAPGIAMAAPVGTLAKGHAAGASTVNHAFAPQKTEVNVKFDNAPANMAVTKISSSPNQKTTVNTGKQGARK